MYGLYICYASLKLAVMIHWRSDRSIITCWNLASSWEASQHGLILAVSCMFRHSAWSCQSLEVIGLRAADALQKDLDIATGMVSSKTVQWSRHTVKQQILLVSNGHRIPELIQKTVWGSGVIMVIKSGSHWLAHLVVSTSYNFGATITLIYQKGD